MLLHFHGFYRQRVNLLFDGLEHHFSNTTNILEEMIYLTESER